MAGQQFIDTGVQDVKLPGRDLAMGADPDVLAQIFHFAFCQLAVPGVRYQIGRITASQRCVMYHGILPSLG